MSASACSRNSSSSVAAGGSTASTAGVSRSWSTLSRRTTGSFVCIAPSVDAAGGRGGLPVALVGDLDPEQLELGQGVAKRLLVVAEAGTEAVDDRRHRVDDDR